MIDPDELINTYDRAKPNRWISCLVVLVVLVAFLTILTFYLGRSSEDDAGQPGTNGTVEESSGENNDG